MPRPRYGYVQLATMIDEEANQAIRSVMRLTGRPIAQEVSHAIKRHAAQPPKVVVEADPLDPVEIKVKPKKNRGTK